MIVSVFSFSVLAKADDTNVFANKKIYHEFDFIRQVEPNYSYKINDASDSTYYSMPSPTFADLGTNYDLSGLRVLAKKNLYNTIKFNLIFYDSEKKELYSTRKFDVGSSAKGDTLEYKDNFTVKNVRYIRLAGGGTLYDLKIFGSVYRPSITNLKDVVDGNNVSFNWLNPIDPTFKGVKIYRGSELIATVDPKGSSYSVSNLEAGKEYEFKFVSLYEKDGNVLESDSINKKINTKMPLVDPPKNVYVTPQNGSLIINWESVKSEFLKGYNVYVDGKKVNDELLTSNKLILKNMENDKEYSVQISAVNLEDKEGDKSAAVTESPSKDATTIEYDLKPPLTGMEFLKTCGTIVLWLSPFILIGIVVIWFKPLKDLIVKAVLDHKKKGEKK